MHGEMCKLWRRRRVRTHRSRKVEVVEVHVGERIQFVSWVGSALGAWGGIKIHVASQDDEYEEWVLSEKRRTDNCCRLEAWETWSEGG